MAAQGNRCIGGGAPGVLPLKRGQRSGGMQTRLSPRPRGLRKGTEENERGKVVERAALSSKSSCDCRRNAVTAEGEDVKTNWIFASVTSFFADNSDLFSFCGRSLKPERRHSRRRLYNRCRSIAVLSSNIPDGRL